MAGVFKTIAPEDQTITPFKVYKSWEYTGTIGNKYSELTSQSIFVLTAIQPTPSNFSNGLMPLDFQEETDLDLSTSLLNSNYKFIPAGVLWQSLKHQYFNDYKGQINFGGYAQPNINNPSNLDIWSGTSFKPNAPQLTKTYAYIDHTANTPSGSLELGNFASVISIPQAKFGEEIKPGSVQIIIDPGIGANYTLIDDSNGNLIDSSIDSSFKLNNRLIRLGFDTDNIISDPRYPTEITSYNTVIQDSFLLSPTTSRPLGKSIYLSESYVRIDGTPSYFNPRTLDNYAVSFWFKLEDLTPSHGRNSHLISKRSLAKNYGLINTSGRRVPGNIWRPNNKITPYDIYVTQAGNLQAQVGDGSTLLTINAGAVSAGTAYHVVLQKSGSSYELYKDGSKTSTTANLSNINNDADIFIGCKGLDIYNNDQPWAAMVGNIDDVQIYNTYLTQTEIDQLSSQAGSNNLNIPNVGKIFYKEGIIVINNIDSKYGGSYALPDYTLFPTVLYNNGPAFNGYAANDYITNPGTVSTADSITIKWNSTLTLYENEILCRINEEEFNFTLNPSILKDSENGQLPKEFIYNDEFGPYITTIGLYNENAELLAIGKLGGPIKKRSNVDLNIIVRFDQ
jgi:hypothetical protein